MLTEIASAAGGEEASFTRIEEEVRRFWQAHGLDLQFARSVADADDRQARPDPRDPAVIYQQPLSVGQSVSARAQLLSTADLLTRYHIMRGHPVQCRMGWSCHGLPVEALVESSLGRAALNYDLAQFNAACRDTAVEGIRSDEALAERLGVWLNPSSTYASLTPQSIGAVWGAIRRLWDTDHLRSRYRIAPTCTRCATPLSDAEAERLIVRAETASLWLQLPWEGEPNAYFLVWVPLPWMLTGMVALAAHPDATYVVIEVKESAIDAAVGQQPLRLVLAEAAVDQVVEGSYSLVRQMTGKALRGVRYHPPFTFVPAGERTHRMVLSDKVPLDQGTGLLPVTPAFHTLSLALAQAHSLPISEFLDEWYRLDESAGRWRGLTPLAAEPQLVDDMQARGLVLRKQLVERLRALCPYCETPLLPVAQNAWCLETSTGSWMISRDRPWGTPLPIWSCALCSTLTCVEGLDDLAYRTGMDVDQIDPHRPAVDRLSFRCDACGGRMQRVTPIIDAEFDSAVLPWATAALPGPANVAIGFDGKGHGWLGDVDETSKLVSGKPASLQSIGLQDMAADWAMDSGRRRAADVIRWAAFTATTPREAERDSLRPLWRSLVRMLTNSESARHQDTHQLGTGELLLDNWLTARLHETVSKVTQALEVYDVYRATGTLSTLISDLVDWYAPQRPCGGCQALEILAKLLAPFLPHLAEVIYREGDWRVNGRAESVHLCEWPTADDTWQESGILQQMESVRRLAALGQEARRRAGVGSDQMLRKAVIGTLPGYPAELDQLALFADLLAEVLGVTKAEFSADAATRVRWRLSLKLDDLSGGESAVHRQRMTVGQINSLLAELGPVAAADLASQLRAGLSVRVEGSGQGALPDGVGGLTLLPDEVNITPQASRGWMAAAGTAYLILLATN